MSKENIMKTMVEKPGKRKTPSKAKGILKLIYLYILSFVGIIITVVAMIGMLNLVLREYILQVPRYEISYPVDICLSPKVNVDGSTTAPTLDQISLCEKDQKQQQEWQKTQQQNDTKRDLASQLAAIIIGLPLWLYHWGLIRRKNEDE